jgi:hypothetical protein
MGVNGSLEKLLYEVNEAIKGSIGLSHTAALIHGICSLNIYSISGLLLLENESPEGIRQKKPSINDSKTPSLTLAKTMMLGASQRGLRSIGKMDGDVPT